MLLLAALACAPAAALPPSELPTGSVTVDAAQLRAAAGDARTLSSRWSAWLDAGAYDALSAAIAAARRDDPATVLALRALLPDLAGRGHDDAAARSVLTQLAQWPALVWRRHEETRADWFQPLFDPGAAARFSLDRIERADTVARWRDAFRRDAAGALDAALSQPRQAELAAAAIASLDAPAMKSLLRAPALKSASTLPGPVAVALARRDPTPARFDAALRTASAEQALALLADTPALLPAEQSRAWLASKVHDRSFGSAAVIAFVRSAASDDDDVDATLRSWLRDPALAPSVAGALARGGLAPIERLLDGADDATTLQHLALALRLHGSDAARALLRVLASDPRLPGHVRAELSR